jgi:predicted component of type VI protein secretion system
MWRWALGVFIVLAVAVLMSLVGCATTTVYNPQTGKIEVELETLARNAEVMICYDDPAMKGWRRVVQVRHTSLSKTFAGVLTGAIAGLTAAGPAGGAAGAVLGGAVGAGLDAMEPEPPAPRAVTVWCP